MLKDGNSSHSFHSWLLIGSTYLNFAFDEWEKLLIHIDIRKRCLSIYQVTHDGRFIFVNYRLYEWRRSKTIPWAPTWMMDKLDVCLTFFLYNLGIFSRWLMTHINALQESLTGTCHGGLFFISGTLSCGSSYDTVVGAADEHITPLLCLHPVCHLEMWTIECFSQYFLTYSFMWERNQFPLSEKPWPSIQIS